jgi:hypothetical protein
VQAVKCAFAKVETHNCASHRAFKKLRYDLPCKYDLHMVDAIIRLYVKVSLIFYSFGWQHVTKNRERGIE